MKSRLRTGPRQQSRRWSRSLVQAEKYGTPVGQACASLAQEKRDVRMSAAEKKAAALPPKLTVPMILFFLPVLFAVIITPAVIQLTGTSTEQPGRRNRADSVADETRVSTRTATMTMSRARPARQVSATCRHPIPPRAID